MPIAAHTGQVLHKSAPAWPAKARSAGTFFPSRRIEHFSGQQPDNSAKGCNRSLTAGGSSRVRQGAPVKADTQWGAGPRQAHWNSCQIPGKSGFFTGGSVFLSFSCQTTCPGRWFHQSVKAEKKPVSLHMAESRRLSGDAGKTTAEVGNSLNQLDRHYHTHAKAVTREVAERCFAGTTPVSCQRRPKTG